MFLDWIGNRNVLYRIIDVVLLLAKTGHTLRGHGEHSESDYF